MARSNSFSRKLLVPLAISAVTLLLLEIVSWIVFPRLTGRQLDFVELALQRSEQIQTLEEQRDRQKGLYSLHPYVGYSGRPGASIGAEGGPVFNSYGMWTQPGRPFPYKRKRDEFVIAVLGGSVAERFVVIGGEGILQDHLARANDLFRRKKVVLISLATGGYKQPQGLFLLQLAFLSGFDIDAVLNLDGFNELVFAVENVGNEYNPLFPSAFHLGMLQRAYLTRLDEDTAKAIILLRSAERNQLRLTRLLAAFPFRYSATANTFGEVFIRRWERQRADLERTMIIRNAEMPFEIISPPAMKGLGPAEFAVAVWKASSLMTHGMCRQRGIPYLHALQPNQYVPGSKPLSDVELRTAVDPESSWGITVRENYHLLRQAGRELAVSGVPFVDLTQVFSETRGILYIDNCCHFNERGNALIAGPIAAALADIVD